MIPRLALLLAAFVLLPVTLLVPVRPAGGKVYLDIHDPNVRKLPIALPAFFNTGTREGAPLGEEIAQVLREDLKFSGLFDVLNPEMYLEDPKKPALTREAIAFDAWRTIKADALIKGKYQAAGGQLETEARLFDVLHERMLTGKQYAGDAKDLRRMAHRFANEVLRVFTEEPGVFDTQIAFASGPAGQKDLYRMDYDGHNLRKMTADGTINTLPSWAPDGESLLFTSYKWRNPDLYRLSLRDLKAREVSTRPGMNTGGIWSPKGDKIALTLSKDGDPEIYLMAPDGSGLQRLTHHRGIDVSPTWSPDGRRIAFVSDRTGSPQVYLMDAAGGDVRRLTLQGSYNTSPAWSPRGDRIAFVSRVGGTFQIFLIAPDGNHLQQLTTAGNNEDPSWSPDGRFLAFSSSRNGRYQIYLMNANGANQKRVTSLKGDSRHPAWGPRPKG